jgi:hypothetical protein
MELKMKHDLINKQDMVVDELNKYNHVIKNPNGIKDKINYHFYKDRKMFYDFKSRHLFPKDLYNSEIRRTQKDVAMREKIK